MDLNELKKISIGNIANQLGIDFDKNGKSLCFKGHDSTPSLSINIPKNYFKCFGCNTQGSTIDLVKEYLNVSTGEAVKWLEKNYGNTPVKINKPEIKTPVKQSGQNYSEIYRELIKLSDTSEAVQYLQGRGISREITELAEIKTIPKDHTNIKKSLYNKYGLENLKAAGLVADGKNGKPYFVFFNNRLLIPYHDTNGNIINMQGRAIDNNNGPKYVFLSGIDTSLYGVRGLHEANGGTVYLCEGVIDALSCLQLGLKYPVSVAGVNNFKNEYFDILTPYKIIIASDRDHAGNLFYIRIKKEFLKRGKKILTLNFDKLKQDCNITGDIKDLNDIARLADYTHFNSIINKKPDRYFSPILNDTCIEYNGGSLFDSGIKYSNIEMDYLKGTGPATLQLVHKLKKIFNGVVTA